MDTNDAYSSTNLLLRSLSPSLASVSVGLLFSVMLIAAHMLFFSLNVGSFTPGLSSDAWIESYTNGIIRPVETFIHNTTLNTLLTAVVWGLVGLVIYSGLEAVINAFNTWHSDKQQVLVVDSKKIQLHPLRRTWIIQKLWRLLISISGVLLIVLTGSVTHGLLVSLDKALNGKSSAAISLRIGLTIIAWTALIHLYIVLLRLFMFRTRVTGELIH